MNKKISKFAQKSGFGVLLKILSINLYQVFSHFQSIDKKMRTPQTRGLKLNPVQKGGQLG